MSELTKISIEVIKYPNHFIYRVCSPAGDFSLSNKQEALKEFDRLLEICERVAVKEYKKEED